MNPKNFSESAKGFTKSPLGIIALFIVLVYGVASLVVSFGQNIGKDMIAFEEKMEKKFWMKLK